MRDIHGVRLPTRLLQHSSKGTWLHRLRTAPDCWDGSELVAAIVDRLTFNAHIVETGTESFRLRSTKAKRASTKRS